MGWRKMRPSDEQMRAAIYGVKPVSTSASRYRKVVVWIQIVWIMFLNYGIAILIGMLFAAALGYIAVERDCENSGLHRTAGVCEQKR